MVAVVGDVSAPGSVVHGASLLELLTVLAVGAVLAGAASHSVGGLGNVFAVETARTRIVLALLDARRIAYAHERTVVVRVEPGAREVVVDSDVEPAPVSLPAGISISSAPATRRVRFFASGLADNATIVVERDGEAGVRGRIVVNQRGSIR
jgi:hypothetical protein